MSLVPFIVCTSASGGDSLLVTASAVCFCQSLRLYSLGFDCAPRYQDGDSVSFTPMVRGNPNTGFILFFWVFFFTLSPPLPFSIKYSTTKRRINVKIQRCIRAFSSKTALLALYFHGAPPSLLWSLYLIFSLSGTLESCSRYFWDQEIASSPSAVTGLGKTGRFKTE